MPNLSKRGRERGQYFNKGFEHDDRTLVPHDGTRRVSFKSHGRRNKNNRQRGWDNKIRALLQDEDVDMNSATGRTGERFNGFSSDYVWESTRYNYRETIKKLRQALNTNVGVARNANRGYHRGERSRGKKFLPESTTNWYKVSIRYGDRYEKEYLLKILANYIKPLPFIPFGYKIINNETSFAVENHAVAEELLKADRRITVSDGYRMSIQVRPYHPVVEMNSKITETMTKVMSSRYNMYTKALDISQFHLDPHFLSENIFCPLNKENVMAAAIGIIHDSIPDLVALDVSSNKINTLHFMKSMVEKVPNLKILHIGKNKLRDVKQLDALKGLNLEELVLDGNSLCDKYNQREDYIREVRVRFPKVIKLDGVELPPPILFDVGDDECKLPPSQASFMCDNGAIMVRPFLEQYYHIYDSESREPLVQAYHDDAQFSLDCYLPPGTQSSLFSAYLQGSRNLFKVSSSEKRMKLLKAGKNRVVEMLRSLPRTQHDPTSFIVDLVLFTPTLIELNVCGLFKEKDKDETPVKYFNRLFIIVPHGTGYCIVNELLTIMPATADQIKKLAKVKEAAAAATGSPSAAAPLPAALDIATKQQMVSTLSEKSGMNLLWSEKCLTDTNWNFDQALNAFLQLQQLGSIPPQAFQK